MKKLFTLLCAVLLTMTASAQFEKGKNYIGATLSGLNLSYNGDRETTINVDAMAGRFLYDNILVYGRAGYSHQASKDYDDILRLGIGGRYYITQNGIFLGANVNYIHADPKYNDLMPGVEVGYAFFLSHTVTIEPSIYYEQSFKSHKDFSTIGFRIGFSIYLGKD